MDKEIDVETVKSDAKQNKWRLELFAKTALTATPDANKNLDEAHIKLFSHTLEAYVQERIFLALKTGEVELV